MKTASQRPISLRRVASTITANGSSSHLQGEYISGGESPLKTNFGKSVYPSFPGIDEAPLSIEQQRKGKPLEALHLPDGATVGSG